jgi:hypothetical protein
MIKVISKLLHSIVLIFILSLPNTTIAEDQAAATLIVMGTVLINNTWVTDNLTFSSPARLSTTAGTFATIDAGQRGRLFLTENTELQVIIHGQTWQITLYKGELRVQSAAATALTITTNTDPLVEVINGRLQITAQATANNTAVASNKLATNSAKNEIVNSNKSSTVLELATGERFVGSDLGAMQLETTTKVDCRIGLRGLTDANSAAPQPATTAKAATAPWPIASDAFTKLPFTTLPATLLTPSAAATATVSRILAANDDNVTPSGPITPTGR